MSASTLLNRLERVRETTPGKWRARCPAHDSQSLTLAIAEIDGRTLIKCFAGCETEAILRAVDLSFADLFDQALGNHKFAARSSWNARDVLDLVLIETHVIACVASDFLAGRSIAETDWQRLACGASRLVEIGNTVRG